MLHTVEPGNDRLLLVGVTHNKKAEVTGVSYSGNPMVLVGATKNSDGNDRGYVDIYRMVNPPVGPVNVVVSFKDSDNRGFTIGATNLFGVDTSNPVISYAFSEAKSGAGNAVINTISLNNIPSALGQLVYSVVSSRDPSIIELGSGQTGLWNLNSESSNDRNSGAGSYKEATGLSTSISYTRNNPDNKNQHWVIGAVSIRPTPHVITSNLNSNFGSSGFYQTAATSSPTSFNATGLPTGMSVDTSTGLITVGASTPVGFYSITISASNSSGTGSATLYYAVCGNSSPAPVASSDSWGYNSCLNAPIAPIIHTLSGVISLGTPSGLPAGLISTLGGTNLTISGTPASSGTFNYTIPEIGCSGTTTTVAKGTIVVGTNCVITDCSRVIQDNNNIVFEFYATDRN